MAGTQLSALRGELRARLGLGAVADTQATNKTILNSILSRAQNWLYWNYGWDNLRRTWAVPLTIGLQAYSYPVNGASETIEQRRVMDLFLLAPGGGYLNTLREGIPPGLRGTVANGPPTRFSQRGVGLTIWPAPDLNTYTLNMEGYKQLAAFAVDADLSTMDDEPILDLGIALGKYHYGQADAQAYVGLVNQLISKLNDSNDVSGRVDMLTEAGGAGKSKLPGREA